MGRQSPHPYNGLDGGSLQNATLRKYLLEKRVELYEEINELKDRMLYTDSNFSSKDGTELAVAESQLNLVKEIITICKGRNRF